MKYSSFNWWKHRGKRGWIIGPFFGYQLSIVLESMRRDNGCNDAPCEARGCSYDYGHDGPHSPSRDKYLEKYDEYDRLRIIPRVHDQAAEQAKLERE